MQKRDVAATKQLSVIEHGSSHLKNEILYSRKFALYDIKFIAVVF